MIFRPLTNNGISYRNKRDKVRIQCAIAALNAGEPAQALEQIRHTLSTWHNVNMPWNIFSKAATAQGSLRNVQKLLFVMSQSFPKCLPLRLTIGHYHSMNVSLLLISSLNICLKTFQSIEFTNLLSSSKCQITFFIHSLGVERIRSILLGL